ncbi:MerR family transcriptional regulator [Pseudonocardia hydrocarbonoxydans]|uniref:Transcriptional regulator n=1 Tax=Pseudonocardia hydrocarbonoxydans TaxID=76726 RepID=A0A4Y3WJ24_9PSEU|nr:MerR family transcriptional regulator [Pseudonocardia hydrocarbonoxydans]GEC18020.1 transcriptional regulator [Pseudonocardia hydrocarbonoxydans]
MLIGEVARRSGVSARMLRHYESLGLVRPTGRSASGYREYSGEDVRRLLHVESLRSLGLSLREVGRALDDPAFAPAELVDDLVRRTRARIADETELLTRLRGVGSAGPADWADVLRIVALLRSLASDSAGRRQQAALSTADDGTVPVDALADAVLGEADPHVAGALRWALARAGGAAVARLADGLGSPAAAVRERAVRSLVEIPDAAATAALHDALAHPDAAVRRCAASALGARGSVAAIPTLVGMVVDGADDVDAADALGVLAADPAVAGQVADDLVGALDGAGPPARRRLAQAMAEVPGPVTRRALAVLARDDDRAVALTAAYVLRVHDGR